MGHGQARPQVLFHRHGQQRIPVERHDDVVFSKRQHQAIVESGPVGKLQPAKVRFHPALDLFYLVRLAFFVQLAEDVFEVPPAVDPPPLERVLRPYDLCEVFHQGEYLFVPVAVRKRRAARPRPQYDDVGAARPFFRLFGQHAPGAGPGVMCLCDLGPHRRSASGRHASVFAGMQAGRAPAPSRAPRKSRREF